MNDLKSCGFFFCIVVFCIVFNWYFFPIRHYLYDKNDYLYLYNYLHENWFFVCFNFYFIFECESMGQLCVQAHKTFTSTQIQQSKKPKCSTQLTRRERDDPADIRMRQLFVCYFCVFLSSFLLNFVFRDAFVASGLDTQLIFFFISFRRWNPIK